MPRPSWWVSLPLTNYAYAHINNLCAALPEDQVADEVGEVIGPDAAGVGPGGHPSRVGRDTAEVGGAAGHHGPGRLLLAGPRLVRRECQVAADPADQPRAARQGPHDRVEVDIAVGDVEGQ